MQAHESSMIYHIYDYILTVLMLHHDLNTYVYAYEYGQTSNFTQHMTGISIQVKCHLPVRNL